MSEGANMRCMKCRDRTPRANSQDVVSGQGAGCLGRLSGQGGECGKCVPVLHEQAVRMSCQATDVDACAR